MPAELIPLNTDGEYAIGAIDWMLPPRDETFDLAPLGLFARVFYPVDEENHETHTKRLPNPPRPEYLNFSLYGKIANYASKKSFGGTEVELCWNAPLAKGEKKFPVVIMSHGYTAHRAAYMILCSQYVTRGYIVVAPEHKDGSAIFTYTRMPNADGVMVEHPQAHHPLRDGQKAFDEEDQFMSAMIFQRGREVLGYLSTLDTLNAGKLTTKSNVEEDFDWTQFHNRLDMKNLIMTGHSYGCLTAFYTMGLTDRFKVCFGFDGPTFPLFDHSSRIFNQIKKNGHPLVSLLCDHTGKSFYNKGALHKSRRVQQLENGWPEIILKNTKHFAFADCNVLNNAYLSRKLMFGSMPGDQFMTVVNDIMFDIIAQLDNGQPAQLSKDLVDKHGEHFEVTSAAKLKEEIETLKNKQQNK